MNATKGKSRVERSNGAGGGRGRGRGGGVVKVLSAAGAVEGRPRPLLTEVEAGVLPGVSAVARYWDAGRSPVGRCRRCPVCRVVPYYRDASYLICLVGEPDATAGA